MNTKRDIKIRHYRRLIGELDDKYRNGKLMRNGQRRRLSRIEKEKTYWMRERLSGFVRDLLSADCR